VGTYADSLLSEGETVVRRERQHWLALLLDSRHAFAIWIIALAVLLAIWLFHIGGQGLTVLEFVVAGGILIGLVIFAIRFWQWRTEEYLVTTRRLLKVSGIINKESGDSSLEKINDAVLFENLLGRLLNYGDLDILTAAEVAVDRYRMLHHAKAFKIDMLNAKHTLEHEVAYVEMPSPPLKADGNGESPVGAPPVAPVLPAAAPMDPVTPAAASVAPVEPATEGLVATAAVPVVQAADAPAAAVATAAPPAETPNEVMDALTRLAELRDHGAITPDEYEAKKQELLGRL
jgi:Short C-terminal domain/Bacterial PH domain